MTDRWALLTLDAPDGQHSTPALAAVRNSLAEALPPSDRESVNSYPDLQSLGEAVDGEIEVPELVLVDLVASSCVDLGMPESANSTAARTLSVLQAWLSDERWAATRLVFLTRGAVAVTPGEEVVGLAQAPVWGLVRSAQSEHPGRFALVDLDTHDASLRALPVALAMPDEPQLALREGTTLAPLLSHVPPRQPPIGQSDNGNPAHWHCDPHGTALITGGTSGLGALVARHLVAEHGLRSVLLISRRGLDAPGAVELHADLADMGARVHVAACDVSDRDSLRHAVSEIPPELPLRLIIHAAGLLDDGIVESLTAERLHHVLSAKADAAWHLHELTQAYDLQGFVLFSSAASILGSAGQGNYAAANAFLDALAAHRHALGLVGTALAWGPWDQTTGMTSRLSKPDLDRIGSLGAFPLSTAEGLALFDASQDASQPLLVPMRTDPAALRAQARAGLLPAVLRSLVRSPARRPADADSLARRLSAAPETEHERLILDFLRTEIAAALRHTESNAIDPSRPFNDLGFNSLAGLELRNRLNITTGLRLPPSLIFDYPTPAALASHLLTTIAPKLPNATGLVDTELDQLERILSATPVADPAERTRIAGRLDTLQARLTEQRAASDIAIEPDDLASASDEELFAAVDQELGSQ